MLFRSIVGVEAVGAAEGEGAVILDDPDVVVYVVERGRGHPLDPLLDLAFVGQMQCLHPLDFRFVAFVGAAFPDGLAQRGVGRRRGRFLEQLARTRSSRR